MEKRRYHQIRVQFSSRGYPLYGDHKYNLNVKSKSDIALFSHQISFNHPITNELLTFELPLPKKYPWNTFKYLDIS